MKSQLTTFGLPTDGDQVEYPDEYLLPVTFPPRNPDDPFAYLGPIRYTGNSWTSRGTTKDLNNLLMGNHMNKTCRFEEARRLVLAESPGGLPPDIDNDQLTGTRQAYYEDNQGPDRTKNQMLHDKKVNPDRNIPPPILKKAIRRQK